MLVSEKLFKKSIRENLYVSIRETFQRRVSEKAIYVSIRETF